MSLPAKNMGVGAILRRKQVGMAGAMAAAMAKSLAGCNLLLARCMSPSWGLCIAGSKDGGVDDRRRL